LQYWYVVVALDVHGNASPASNEANVPSTATGVDGPLALGELRLDPNVPNPFAGCTDIMLAMPAAGNAVVEVYDVTGRRVRGPSTRGYRPAVIAWRWMPGTMRAGSCPVACTSTGCRRSARR